MGNGGSAGVLTVAPCRALARWPDRWRTLFPPFRQTRAPVCAPSCKSCTTCWPETEIARDWAGCVFSALCYCAQAVCVCVFLRASHCPTVWAVQLCEPHQRGKQWRSLRNCTINIPVCARCASRASRRGTHRTRQTRARRSWTRTARKGCRCRGPTSWRARTCRACCSGINGIGQWGGRRGRLSFLCSQWCWRIAARSCRELYLRGGIRHIPVFVWIVLARRCDLAAIIIERVAACGKWYGLKLGYN